jgi:type I restriction enzyme R subunit
VDIAPDKVNGEAREGTLGCGDDPERTDYRQVVLLERLRKAVNKLNPSIPAAVADLGIPVLLSANRHFHKLLVTGVPVQYQLGGETRGDFVRLIDWTDSTQNE